MQQYQHTLVRTQSSEHPNRLMQWPANDPHARPWREPLRQLDQSVLLNAPKAVNGTGNVTVNVKPARTRTGSSNILKKIPIHRLHQGERAAPGPVGPPASTGENHDPSLDS
jgi:hypothetical protein